MSDRTATVKSYVPFSLREAEPFKSIYEAGGAESGDLHVAIEDVLIQLYVPTATWGLAFWEEFLELETDVSQSNAYRRSVIISKLRGVGTFTKSMVMNAALSYENGEIKITEYATLGYFKIKFVSLRGIPPNYDQFKSWLEDIKPAHLGVIYEFSFMTWDEFDVYNKPWDQWDILNLTWDEFEMYN
jgi:hypothetical protein